MPDDLTTLPFWSDDFDMDLPKIIPSARETLGDRASIEMVTTGTPDERTGRLNHPAVWNHAQGMVAFFGFRSPRRPPGMVAPGAGDIRCTAWEAFRDAWPHGYLMIVEGTLVWNTFGLQDSFATIMFHLRGWRHDPEADAAARRLVAESYAAAVRRFGELVEKHGARP